MSINRGKQFEQQFEKDWADTFKEGICIRLPDQQSGYYGTSRNICDFICYNFPNFYLIECKSIHGNTFPLSNFTQFSKISKFIGVNGLRCGVVLWFIDHDKIFYIPTSTFKKLAEGDKKSFNVNMEGDENYKSYLLPSIRKRIFLQTDYSQLKDLKEGE